MQLHDLQPNNKKSDKKRVGRGGKYRKTAGRGTKGQKARAGATPRPQIRDRIKKLPKLRGYKFNSVSDSPAVVNVGEINESFSDGDIVSPERLVKKEVVEKDRGNIPKVKILGAGDIDSSVTVIDCTLSASAQEKIEAAGGTVQ